MEFLLFFFFAAVLLVLFIVTLSRLGELRDHLERVRIDLRDVVADVKALRIASFHPQAPDLPQASPPASPPLPRAEPALAPPPVVPPVPLGRPLPESSRAAERSSRQPASPPALPARRVIPETRTHADAVAAPPLPEPGKFESSVREILAKIWNWIVVGDEHRPKGVTMEFAVATTWLIRIGVLILVIGVGFFLNYSIAKGLIGPVGRVLLATLVGAGLVGGGLRLFGGRYAVLGQGLAGAGFATLYFSFYTAHQPDYGLIAPPVAFALMVLVTAVAALVAVRCNSLLVAVLGLLGGYGTPLMIETAPPGVPLVFSYLLLLGLGMFAVAAKRNWRLLHYLAFAATCLHVATLVEARFFPGNFWQFAPFLLAFFVLFSSVTFIYQIVHRRTSTLLELLFLFLNAAAFTGFMVYLIGRTFEREAIALLTLGLAVFYILHVAVFMKRDLRDRGLLLSFLGLASFFVAITLPIVLSKGWITVSWSVQAFIMLWIASKMRSEFLRQLAYLLYLIVLARFAIVDLRGQFEGLDALSAADYGKHLVERLFIFGIPIGSFVAAGLLFRHEDSPSSSWTVGEGNDIAPLPGQSGVGRVCFWIVVGLSFLYLNLEVAKTVDRIFEPLVFPGLTLVWIGFAFLLLREMLVRRSVLATVLFWLLATAVVAKVYFVDFFSWKPGFDLAFAPEALVPGLLMRLLDYGAVAAFLVLVTRILSGREDRRSLAPVFGYAALAAVFVYSSLEIWTALSQFLPAFRMGGVSIFWSLFAIGVLLTGIVGGRAALRGIGLVLLAGTILKVFFIDLAGLDQLYRIVAFIVLGVVVLVGSFLYFKFSHRFATAFGEAEGAAPETRPVP